MSRRRAYAEPWPCVSDEDLLAVWYGSRRYADRPMPGCRERCCGGGWPILMRLSQTRTDWQLSGMDLVPILAKVLLYLHALLVGVRIGGVL